MKAIYNSWVLPLKKIGLEIQNRAFCYGDGLFETIVTGPERINLLPYHTDRLTRACKILNIEIPSDIQRLEKMIGELISVNELSGDVRAKIQIWRKPGGLYEPEESTSSYLLTVSPTDYPFYSSIDQIGVSKNAKLVYHQLSFAKTISALPYVMAGMEKKERGMDELIITNGEGKVAECISSNLFWLKDAQLCTPSLKTGCVAGTMRAYLLETLSNQGQKLLETKVAPGELKVADSVFLTNAAGIRWVRQFEDKAYANPAEYIQPLIKQPLQP